MPRNADREQRSLFGEILDWMLAPLLLLWPMSVVLTWLVAQGIANQPFDRELGEMARALAKQVSVEDCTAAAARRASRCRRARPTCCAPTRPDDIYYQVLGLRGEFLSGDRDAAGAATDDDRAPPGEAALSRRR